MHAQYSTMNHIPFLIVINMQYNKICFYLIFQLQADQ